MDIFREHLAELEHAISESELLGPVVVTGDFNVHLQKLGGSRRDDDVNVQGVLLHEMMGRCNLSVVSLGNIASGTGYNLSEWGGAYNGGLHPHGRRGSIHA